MTLLFLTLLEPSSWNDRCLLKFESLTSLQNKSLSGDYDRILQLQGISWFKRQAIKYATITLYVKHYRDDAGFEHIDIDQTITGVLAVFSLTATL